MPVLSFTPADALQTVLVEPGTYTAEISLIDTKASKSAKSVNYFTDIQIVQDGKYKSKELRITLNTETTQASLLGTMQFFPDNTFLIIDAAIRNAKVEAVNKQLDTDDLLHKPFDVVIGVATVDGILINTINGFLPAGSGAAQPGW